MEEMIGFEISCAAINKINGTVTGSRNSSNKTFLCTLKFFMHKSTHTNYVTVISSYFAKYNIYIQLSMLLFHDKQNTQFYFQITQIKNT